MAALTADRATDERDGIMIPVPLKANARVFLGGMVAKDATGYALAAAKDAEHKVIGVAQESVDNTGGADGAKSVLIKRGKAFKFANDGVLPVVQADLGETVYVRDDQTVAHNDGGGANAPAGKCLLIEPDGVTILIS